jgi:hypothetical protein
MTAHTKRWKLAHTCVTCCEVDETVDATGKCYKCRHPLLGKAFHQPSNCGVCVECGLDSETLYYGRCLKCRRKWGYTKMRERINKWGEKV